MTSRDELIEQATWALIDYDTDVVDRGVRDEHYRERRADAERVLAVFEKAHTPTDDEREALARIVRRVIDSAYTFEGDLDPSVDEILIRELLTAGFRRTVQGEPTDAQVEAGCVAFYEHATGLTSWARLVDCDKALANRYRDGMRRALRAALDKEGEGDE